MSDQFEIQVASIAEADKTQYRFTRVLLPLIASIETEDQREAAAVLLEAVATKLSTPAGLTEFHDQIAQGAEEATITEQAPRGSEFGPTWVNLPERITEASRVLHNMVTPDQEPISKEGSI